MPLSTRVFINKITNLSDARYFAGMGADVLGFDLEPASVNAVSKNQFTEITNWVAGVQIFGSFKQLDIASINSLVQELNLDYVLLPTTYSPQQVKEITIPVIIEVEWNSNNDFQSQLTEFENVAEYILLTSSNNSEVTDEALKSIAELSKLYQILLGFGLHADTILKVLEQVKPAGICLSGGNEMKPGLRDFDDISDLLEQLEVD